MIRRPPRSTQSRSSAASDVYKRQPTPCPMALRLKDYVCCTLWSRLLSRCPGGVAQSRSPWNLPPLLPEIPEPLLICLLYTSDAADDLLCVDLGGRRIIKKKK